MVDILFLFCLQLESHFFLLKGWSTLLEREQITLQSLTLLLVRFFVFRLFSLEVDDQLY